MMSAYNRNLSRPSSGINDPRMGIASRGSIDLDHIPRTARSASGNTLLDHRDDLSVIQTRPCSSLGRYEAYAQLSQSTGIVNTTPSLGFPLGSFFEKLNPSAQLTSQTLDQRIQKLIKMEKKVMKQQQELIKDINSWCNILPSDDCKRLLYHFIRLLEMDFDIDEQKIKKQSQIIGQLANVNKRERRTNDLRWKRNKILTKLRESENKVGDSPVTLLTKENLEELECSVEIVEDQFIRSINTGLKNALVDYTLTMKNSGIKYKETSNYFLDHYNFSSKQDNSASSLQKLILQNKYSATPSGQLQSAGFSGYRKTGGYGELRDYEGENGSTTPVTGKTVGEDGLLSASTASTQVKTGDGGRKESDNFNIINSYTTPGALGIMPSDTHPQWNS